MTSLHRVLVVEDHAAFRRVICELLRERADVQIVGEAADGLDAVRQAEALRPDVVMLDVGLPGISGIEAARRIRALVPDAKLMFVTIESSLEVVAQAFSTGAHGYVYKPRALRDLLPVLDAIIRGAQFVSGGLARIAQGDSLASHRHHVVFYSSGEVLVRAFTRFIGDALDEGKAVIVLLNEAHDESVRRSLRASHVDLALCDPREAVRPGEHQRDAREGDGQRPPGPDTVPERRRGSVSRCRAAGDESARQESRPVVNARQHSGRPETSTRPFTSNTCGTRSGRVARWISCARSRWPSAMKTGGQ